jgi:Holliday junction resolvase
MDQNPNNNDTALLKLDAVRFNQALKVIEEFGGVKRSSTRGLTEERIISSVFRKNGYIVTNKANVGNIRADFIASKDGIKYAIEIKLGDYKSVGYRDRLIQNIENILNVYLVEGYIPVLIYDRGWLTQKAKDYLKDKQFIVIDKVNLSEFFDGKLDLKDL